MLKPLHNAAVSWAIEEGDAVFRIVDATGRVLAEIPFAHRSTSKLSRGEAKQMAEEMVTAGDHLANANANTMPKTVAGK